MKNVLFLVHVEETFRRMFGPMYVQRLRKVCRSSKYHSVIHLTSHVNDDEPIRELVDLIGEEIDFAWGYEPEQFDSDDPEQFWIIPANSVHEYTWVPPELRDGAFSDCNIYVGGGYRSECLADFLSVLEHCGLSYKVVDGYVYG